MISWLFINQHGTRRYWINICKVQKINDCQPRVLYFQNKIIIPLSKIRLKKKWRHSKINRTKRVCNWKTSPSRNMKYFVSLGWNKNTLESQSSLCEVIKSTRKDKQIGEYKRLYEISQIWTLRKRGWARHSSSWENKILGGMLDI